MFSFLLQRMFLPEGDGQKPPRTKPSTQKAPEQNPRTKTPAN